LAGNAAAIASYIDLNQSTIPYLLAVERMSCQNENRLHVLTTLRAARLDQAVSATLHPFEGGRR